MYTKLFDISAENLERSDFNLSRIAKRQAEQLQNPENNQYWVSVVINDLCKVVIIVDNGYDVSRDIHISKDALDNLFREYYNK